MIVVIKHAPHEGLGTFERIILEAGHEIEVVEASQATDREWERVRSAGRLILMGGAMGVYEAERYPFLARELELLRERLAADRPTLGVCLGAQLIAQAAGAQVRPSGRQEIGWYPVSLTAEGRADRLVGGLDWSGLVFHWHGDTFETPPGAVHLLTSQRFTQQGFRIGLRGYGLQFHPEVPEADLPEWLASEPGRPFGHADGIQSRSEILDGGRAFATSMESLAAGLMRRLLTDIWR